MFKENKEFWLYIVGTIALFLGTFYVIIRSDQFDFFSREENNQNGQYTYQEVPGFDLDEDINYYAVLETNFGNITLDLFEENAPNTVNNFIFLAEKNYYNGTKFHRLETDLLLQGGSRNTLNTDPGDDRYGGPGYVFEDELNWNSINLSKERKEQLRELGYVSNSTIESRDVYKYRVLMANAGPNTNGSQFFIVLADSAEDKIEQLRGRYTVFAEVVEGKQIIDSLNDLPVDIVNGEPKPAEDIVLNNVKIIKSS